ncbi:MAG: hypothetical protein ACK4WM_01505 [Thermoflexales bacterium]
MSGSPSVVLVVLVLAYVLLALTLSGIAWLLRRREPFHSQRLAAVLSLAPIVRERIDAANAKIAQPVLEPPYGPLFQEAEALVLDAQQLLAHAYQWLSRSEVLLLKQQPIWQALLVLPLLRELANRIRWEQWINRAEDALRRVQHDIDQFDITLKRVEDLPAEENRALLAASQRLLELKQAVHTEVRTKLPLEADRQLLEQLSQEIDYARQCIGSSLSDKQAVITVYRLRCAVEERLKELSARVDALQAKRVETAQLVKRAESALEQLRLRIEADEASGMPRPSFSAQLLKSLNDFDAAVTALDTGDYETAQTQAREVAESAKTQVQALEALERARMGLSVTVDKLTARLNTLEGWIAELKQTITPDILEEYRNRFRAMLDQMRAALLAESVEAIESAGQQKQMLNSIYSTAERSRSEALALLHERAQQLRVVNEDSVAGLIAQAEQRALELDALHRRYQQPVSPAALREQAADLKARWESITMGLASLRQSSLLPLVQSLGSAREVLESLRQDLKAADQQVAQFAQDKQRASQPLHSEEAAHIRQALADIIHHAASLERAARSLLDEQTVLLAACEQAAPDFSQIAEDSERWLSNAKQLVSQYDAELHRAQVELRDCVRRIQNLSAELKALEAEHGFDFCDRVTPLLMRLDSWFAAAEQSSGLDAVRRSAATGVQLCLVAEEALREMRAEARAVNHRYSALRERLAELSGLMASVRAGLESLPLRELGSANWSSVIIGPLEQRTRELQQRLDEFAYAKSGSPLTISASRAWLTQIEEDVHRAIQEAESARLQVSQMRALAVGHFKALRQALQAADELARERPELAPELSALKDWLREVDSRCARSSSWEDALALLNQMTERLSRFRGT